MRPYSRTLMTLAICAVLLAPPAHSEGLECPSTTDLRVSRLEDDVSKFLPEGHALAQPAQLQAAIQLLREHGMSADDTVNYLIAIYCPTVSAQSSLSHDDKVAKVRSFAADATRLVLTSDNIRDIVYDVPLPPSVAAAVETRAHDVGLTAEQWIATTVEVALK